MIFLSSRRTFLELGFQPADEMATVVSALEARGLPRLITVVITSENAERTLGEALAEAVKEMRAEKRRVEKVKSMDFVEEMRKLDAAALEELGGQCEITHAAPERNGVDFAAGVAPREE
mgnify:CR=1 FL=1